LRRNVLNTKSRTQTNEWKRSDGSWIGDHDYVLLLMPYSAGARVPEIIGVKVDERKRFPESPSGR